MKYKVCKTCKIEKQITEFYKGLRCLLGVRPTCKKCDLIRKKAYAQNNKNHVAELKKADYEKHKEKHLAQKKIYRQSNKAKVNALAKAYKVRKKNRIPKWVDKDHMWLIKEAYALAELRTKMFGFSWHVDHIIPLQGELVSGLHVIKNLQVIPGVENIKKKNKYEIKNA